MVGDLGVPLGLDVLKRRWPHQREADEEDVGLRVRERSEAVVVLLASGIPQAQVDGLAVHHHVRRVVVEPVSPAPPPSARGSAATTSSRVSRTAATQAAVAAGHGGRWDAHSGDVLAGEGVGGVRDEQAGLADGAGKGRAPDGRGARISGPCSAPRASLLVARPGACRSHRRGRLTYPSPTTTHLMFCMLADRVRAATAWPVRAPDRLPAQGRRQRFCCDLGPHVAGTRSVSAPRPPLGRRRCTGPPKGLSKAALYVRPPLVLRVLPRALPRAAASRASCAPLDQRRAQRGSVRVPSRRRAAKFPMVRCPPKVLLRLPGVLRAAAGPFAVGSGGAWPLRRRRRRRRRTCDEKAKQERSAERQNGGRTPAEHWQKRGSVLGARPTPNPTRPAKAVAYPKP